MLIIIGIKPAVKTLFGADLSLTEIDDYCCPSKPKLQILVKVTINLLKCWTSAVHEESRNVVTDRR